MKTKIIYILLALAVTLTSCNANGPSSESSSDNGVTPETPVETPMSTPIDTPTETPTDTPTETPVQTPEETPAETPPEDESTLGNVNYSDEFTSGLNFLLNADENTYSVSKYTGMDKDVVIPKIYKGCYVTSIGPSAFSGRGYLESVTIPDSITSIGDRAFSGCS